MRAKEDYTISIGSSADLPVRWHMNGANFRKTNKNVARGLLLYE